MNNLVSRRKFLMNSALAGGGLLLSRPPLSANEAAPDRKKAKIAITLDLEMMRNFPKWEDTHWDYEKGNLTDSVKQYAVEAARRVKARGGIIHFFLVARALEQENVDWLKELVREGHRIGNHSYDHVYVRAKTISDVQYRFKRAPWLAAGRTPLQLIRDNIKMGAAAIKSRLGIEPAGFRTPGGFADGLTPAPEVQKMFLDLGYKWVSCRYPAHPNSNPPGTPPTPQIFNGILKAHQEAQPFVYPSGLIDIPMSPISDVDVFRNQKWQLEDFLKTIRMGVEWAVENHAVYDFLSHPSVLSVKDPDFKAINLICDLVQKAGDRASLVDLETIAHEVKVKARS